jgi:hypothetical protein
MTDAAALSGLVSLLLPHTSLIDASIAARPALVEGPYAEPLMWSIIQQVDSEIALIKAKRGLDGQ